MTLNQLIQDVGLELQELLWRDVPYREAMAQRDRLEAQLREQSSRVEQLRSRRDEHRQRLADQERRAAWLEERVAIYLHVGDRVNAWRHALELDQLRKGLDAQRRQLRQQGQAYHGQLARLRHLRQRLADLQERPYAER